MQETPDFIGDPGWIRTSDLQLRRLLLYPLSYGATRHLSLYRILRRNARLIVRMGLPLSAKNPAKTNERAVRLEQLRPASNLRPRHCGRRCARRYLLRRSEGCKLFSLHGLVGHEPDKIVASTCRTGSKLRPLGGLQRCLRLLAPVSR